MDDDHLPVRRIDWLEASILEVPVSLDRLGNPNLLTASGTRAAIMARVGTDDGLTGTCYATVLAVSPGRVLEIVRDHLAGAVLEGAAGSIAALWQRMFERTRCLWSSREAALRAIGVIDAALWDLVGRASGRPLHRVWGGTPRPLRAVAMAPVWDAGQSDADAVEQVAVLVAWGAGGVKLKVGLNSPLGPLGDAERVMAVRSAFPADFAVIADANQGWSVKQAITFADRAHEVGLEWLEEPCHWEADRRMMAHLRREIDVPIAAGQSELLPEHCRDLMEAGAIDVCNMDAALGGPSAWRRMAAFAGERGIGVVAHLEPQLGLQLATAAPHARFVEFVPAGGAPFLEAMFDPLPLSGNGHVVLPDRPGWGIDPDPVFVAAHTTITIGRLRR